LLTIHLHNLIFHAHHGLFAEEQLLGNDFEVNISIKHLPAKEKIISLEQTINYVAVHELVKQRMKQPTPLLETLAQEICEAILAKFSLAEEVFFSIKKLNPPIINFQGSVGISFELKRSL
jgi:dihydroneopterin aldolase